MSCMVASPNFAVNDRLIYYEQLKEKVIVGFFVVTCSCECTIFPNLLAVYGILDSKEWGGNSLSRNLKLT